MARGNLKVSTQLEVLNDIMRRCIQVRVDNNGPEGLLL
jgi:hypothetical protein